MSVLICRSKIFISQSS